MSNKDEVIALRYIAVSDELYLAREEIKRLQRQVGRLGNENAKLKYELGQARLASPGLHCGSLNELRQSEKDRY